MNYLKHFFIILTLLFVLGLDGDKSITNLSKLSYTNYKIQNNLPFDNIELL